MVTAAHCTNGKSARSITVLIGNRLVLLQSATDRCTPGETNFALGSEYTLRLRVLRIK